MRTLLVELRDEWVKLEEQIDASTRELALFAKKEDGCRRLLTIPASSSRAINHSYYERI